MRVTRRALAASVLAPPGIAAARPDTPARRRAARTFKEVAASLYAWDLADQPCEQIMETLKETAQANSLYLVALMHHEKRPLTDFYFPHNSTRKTYFPEDSRVYWQPHLECYRDSRIKPLASERPEFKGKDFLETLVRAGRKGGWKTGAEISHTVLDKKRAADQFASVVQRDIWGRPAGQSICPNNPDARAYLLALFTDLVKNYDLDFVQTCLRPFAAGERRGGTRPSALERVLETVSGTCFCESCVAAAKAEGFDLNAARRAMLPLAQALRSDDPEGVHFTRLLRASNTSELALLIARPEIFDFLKFRCASMTRLFAHIRETVKKIRPAIDLRLNAYIYDYWELAGIDFKTLRPHLGSIRSSNYDEQSGRMEMMEHKRQFLLSVRAAAGDDILFLSAIGIRPQATPELVRKGVLISAECGADGLSLGHYDGAPLRLLEAIGDGLREADVRVG
ncbi:MAG: hypothetical protein ACE15B_15605 [Bryobacteraceae bacterium]